VRRSLDISVRLSMASSLLGFIACVIVAIFGPGAVVVVASTYSRAFGSYHLHCVVLLAAMVFLGAVYPGVATAFGL
jgi:hypothetical protein